MGRYRPQKERYLSTSGILQRSGSMIAAQTQTICVTVLIYPSILAAMT